MSGLAGVVGVIPARYASTRLPGKPLAPIGGRPMVEWVYRSAKRALGRAVVATDDPRVVSAVLAFGGEAVMTPRSCRTGTDRVWAAARRIPAAYYVNIQGDEPFIEPRVIRTVANLARARRAIATAAVPLPAPEAKDPSVVKTVLGADGRALYFSRSPIPHPRKPARFLKHLGIYAYPRAVLSSFVRANQSAAEVSEQLEQLRALHHGWPIFVAVTRSRSVGIDTPSDLRRARRIAAASI